MTGQTLIPLIVAIFVVAAALGASVPVFKSKAELATRELLESQLKIERDARLSAEEHHLQQITDLELRQAKEISLLRGQVETLTKEFASIIAQKVAEEVVNVVQRST